MAGVPSDTRKALNEWLRAAVSALVPDAAKLVGGGIALVFSIVFGTPEGRVKLRDGFPEVPSQPPEVSAAIEGLYQAAIFAATSGAIAGVLAGTFVGLALRGANIAIIPRECGRGRWLFRIGLLFGFGIGITGLSYFVVSGTLVSPATLFDPRVRGEVLGPLVICIAVTLAAYIIPFASGFVLFTPRALRIACTPWPLCHVFRVLT